MPHIRKVYKGGLSLVEILVAMTAFAVIFTGLASTFQALMIANRVTIDLSDCLHHYHDGMRLLLEGDPSHPIEPHAGLLQAENVATTTVSYSYTDEFGNSQSAVISDALQYYKNNATYTVWAFRGEILRELVAGNPRPIMGNPPTAPAAKRIMVDSLEVAFSPDEIASTTKSLVRLSVFLHGETDDNKQADVNEARLIMHPTVFLRNAELEL